eukprot:m.64794 g.64794  ORF g.64794 m.64794 type:complete len:272 (+) comp13949_c0_seq2:76-891(+)
MRYAQLVMGPAGSGKSTYCSALARHCEAAHRTVHIVNLDPAAEAFDYPIAWDVRDVISLDDVADSLGFGPNGGLVYCMEYVVNNLQTLDTLLEEYDDDYIVFDCPGQIELYTHIPVMRKFTEHLQSLDYRVVAVYLLDSQFIDDPAKFFAGLLSAMSTMLHLEIPHVNVLSKVDLLGPDRQDDLETYLDPDPQTMLETLNKRTVRSQHALNSALASLIDEYSMVRFVPLRRDDEDSLADLLYQLDLCVQYGEDIEPREPHDDVEGDEGCDD